MLGNHDVIGLQRWDEWRQSGQVPAPDRHGSYDWVCELRDRDVQWLKDLPLTITLPDQGSKMVVHAGFVPGRSMKDQNPEDLYSIRNVITRDGVFGPCGVSDGTPWGQAWEGILPGMEEGPRMVLFGHDAPRGLQQWPLAWGLDTNCCNGGHLTCCILPSMELASEPALGSLHLIGNGPARTWQPISSNGHP